MIFSLAYGYDASNNRVSMVDHNGVTTAYAYDKNNRLTSTVETTGLTVARTDYTYDHNGNTIAKMKSVVAPETPSDPGDEEEPETTTAATTSTTAATTSTTAATTAGTTTTATTSTTAATTAGTTTAATTSTTAATTAGTTTTATTGVTTTTRNIPTQFTTKPIVGIDPPNPPIVGFSMAAPTSTTIASTTGIAETSSYAEYYEYDLLNRMVYSNTEGAVVTYKYRPDGLRYSKTVNGVETVHIWDGANIVGDVGGTTYVRGINLVASKSNGVFTYYLYNGHGDVVQLANSAGIVTKTYDYDAFGNERSPVASDANPFRYCGEYFDKETSTVYLRARYYSPRIGRFTTMDTYLGSDDDPLSLHLYTYGYNNPIRFFDSNGNTIEDIIKGVVSSVEQHLAGGFAEWLFTKLWGTSVGYIVKQVDKNPKKW